LLDDIAAQTQLPTQCLIIYDSICSPDTVSLMKQEITLHLKAIPFLLVTNVDYPDFVP
jgi:hypothetical protein